jgi:hypothetical protein
LQSWLKQLRPNQQGQDATNDQHREAKQQIQSTNVFVVGCKKPTLPARRRVVVVVMGMIVVI